MRSAHAPEAAAARRLEEDARKGAAHTLVVGVRAVPNAVQKGRHGEARAGQVVQKRAQLRG
jgi:hypothetical protein